MLSNKTGEVFSPKVAVAWGLAGHLSPGGEFCWVVWGFFSSLLPF